MAACSVSSRPASNIAGIVSPTIFGQFLDHGHLRGMFFFMAACALLAIGTVVVSTSPDREGIRTRTVFF
jgi:MFS family permease